MVKILGIDPGSRITGYGIVEWHNNTLKYVDSGTIKTPDGDLSLRLHHIYEHITQIIHQFQPHQCAIEQVFVKLNVQSALKLGQARGAALTAVGQFAVPMFEYSPRAIKQSVCGYGAATKEQVQKMISLLLPLAPKNLKADAADALAIAITHAHQASWQSKTATSTVT